MTLGELLRLEGVAGHDGVVFSGGGAGSLGASWRAMYRSTSAGVMSSPKSGLQFEMLPSVLLALDSRASELQPSTLWQE